MAISDIDAIGDSFGMLYTANATKREMRPWVMRNSDHSNCLTDLVLRLLCMNLNESHNHNVIGQVTTLLNLKLCG